MYSQDEIVVSWRRSYLAHFLGLFVCARMIASLWLPFGWDHGMMAEVGQTYLEGGLPYRDAWDIKGPFAYVVFAAAEATFGRNMWGIRVIDAAIMISAAVILGSAASRLATPKYGPWAALGFLLLLVRMAGFTPPSPTAGLRRRRPSQSHRTWSRPSTRLCFKLAVRAHGRFGGADKTTLHHSRTFSGSGNRPTKQARAV